MVKKSKIQFFRGSLIFFEIEICRSRLRGGALHNRFCPLNKNLRFGRVVLKKMYKIQNLRKNFSHTIFRRLQKAG